MHGDFNLFLMVTQQCPKIDFSDLRNKEIESSMRKKIRRQRSSLPQPSCDAVVLSFLQEVNAFANMYKCWQYTLNKTIKIKQCLSFIPVCQSGLITSAHKTFL